jgi:alkyl hydroperoxide reductase subunit D
VDALEQLRGAIPDAAKDIGLNLQAVLRGGALSEPQRCGVAAAAALMAMNNVYYRFRHMVGKPVYGEKPAGLRMNRIMQPATNRADFELMSLAVSAINGCEMCVRAHEKTVTEGGLTPDHVNDAVRIAATIYASAVALEAGESGVMEAAVEATAPRA